jgi:hypothetical protein
MEATFYGVPKLGLLCIVAINGRWSQSELDCDASPSCFFHHVNVPMWRIFLDLGKGSMISVSPRGVFPGDGVGAIIDRSCRSGGEGQGHIAFSFFSRVISINMVVISLIPLSLRDFDVTMYPPLE